MWSYFDIVLCILHWGFLALGIFAVVAYLGVHFYAALLPARNLKKKYNAEWALVTGGSSGIGKGLVLNLAKQGLNVVIVAVDDSALAKCQQEMSKAFPAQKFRAIGVDLSGSDYMTKIKDGTKDITVTLLFCNAGYLVIGSFRKLPIEQQMKNLECNMMSAVRITHHFYYNMIAAKKQGCIVYTSSAAGYFPAPFSVCYGASKAFISEFSASLAVEASDYGIDVMACHPSYTRTNMYQTTPKLKTFAFLNIFGAEPEAVARQMLRAVGRGLVWYDMGGYAIFTRLISRLFDFNLLVAGMLSGKGMNPDYEAFRDLR